jgi:xylan 1,4-beta-xylosidase
MEIIIDYTSPKTPFKHTWAPMANVDQFRWLSRGDVQKQLEMARDEIGVKYVRAAAMYSPELGVWDYDIGQWRKPGAERKKQANWQMLDINIEALLERGLKPIFTTCFIPEGMTSGSTVCWPDKNKTDLPDNMDEWSQFVKDSIQHQIDRYGLEEVKTWYFECWNEPNLRGTFFGGSMEDFFKLWSVTYKAVKSVNNRFRFGGPSTARGEWIPEFIEFTRADGTEPDFIVTHVYNNDSEGEPLSPFDGPAADRVKDSPNFATGVIRGVRTKLKEVGYEGEVHWNEWGRSWFVYDRLKETALEAAFIVKTMIETSQLADYFGFWCISDIYNQGGYQNSEFQGNYGMLSLHGLRKPAWFAHQVLERLGDAQIEINVSGPLNGAVATASAESTEILIYAYAEKPDDAPVTEPVSLNLPENYRDIKLYRLGADENNVISAWRAMGAPQYPTPSQIKELRDGNTIHEAPAEALAVNGSVASFDMERPGVALFVIS